MSVMSAVTSSTHASVIAENLTVCTETKTKE
jgi:hypothetical protein